MTKSIIRNQSMNNVRYAPFWGENTCTARTNTIFRKSISTQGLRSSNRSGSHVEMPNRGNDRFPLQLPDIR